MRLPTSGAAQLGTAVHASTALFDGAVLAGNPITADDAAGAAVDAIHNPEVDVLWDDDLKPTSAEAIALSLHKRYCADIAPAQTYAGVEVTCERLEISDLGLALTGTTDRVRITRDGEVGIADIKTGATAVSAAGAVNVAGHVAQLGVYELLASQVLGRPVTAPAQVIGMQTGKTAKAQRIACADIEGASHALVGADGCPGVLQFAAGMLKSGLFFGNPRSILCSAKYCPAYHTCRFRG